MRLAMIGLGRMGANMVRRLRRADIPLVAYNRKQEVTETLAVETGLVAADSIEQLVGLIESPRVVWLMFPAGEIAQTHIDRLTMLLEAGDVLIDAANSFYKDSISRAKVLEQSGILCVDAGVSGGIWGLENGYALMVRESLRQCRLLSLCSERLPRDRRRAGCIVVLQDRAI